MHVIVVTDGYTLNPGDLTWQKFDSLGKVIVYDRTPASLLHERCRHATVIVTNKTPVDSHLIQVAKDLKLIAVTATGFNVIDTGAARKANIPVCNVPGYGTDSVAQHTFALILELTNHVGENAVSVNKGEWSSSIDWCYAKKPIVELRGKTLGIVGFGKIGQQTARIAQAFGMNVIYHSNTPRPGFATNVPLDEVFSKSDVVSLHVPLKSENIRFVNHRLLSLMKSSAYLINTSRGQLINEQDLADALRERKIAGAALDVLSEEPPVAGNPLINLPNCIITPHNAWLSVEARNRILDTTYENIKAALNGNPQNVVNL